MFDEYFAMRSTLWAVLVVLSACTKPNPASCLDDFCDDPALPFCDADGSIGGVPDTCIAVQCTPDEFKGCRDDRALICSADGVNIDEVDCEFGCGVDGCLPCNTPECQPPEKHIIPKYLPDICNDLATTTLAVTEDLTVDTSDDANCTSIVAQTTGPEICVIHHETITLTTNRKMRFKGARALAMVADRQFDLAGILDASADGFANGPGGGTIKSGGGGSSVAGGGAGNQTAGGPGGNAASNGGALNGGVAQVSPASVVDLFGGPQAIKSTPGAPPAGSGGAVTLVCCRCELSVTGTIDVNGEGGQGFSPGFMGGPASPAAGGGAGGNVVLQGLQVTVAGQLFSNGGGGGGGVNSGGLNGDPGEKGRRLATCALGAVGAPGSGGQGGCAVASPGSGLKNATNSGSAGAGGGSTGFLLTYTPSGVVPALNPTVISPAFEPNGVIPTN